MGWYESPKHPGAMVGDEAFDVGYDFLKHLNDAYTAEFGRAPTLDEVVTIFQIALHVNGGGTVAGLAELEVTNVVVKTAKKRKDQPYAEGAIFAVPLGERRFAFGRILMVDKALGCLVEVFKGARRSPAFAPGPNEQRLFQPMLVLPVAFTSWRWEIIDRDASYQQPADLNKFEYVAGSPSLGYSVVNVRNKIIRRATDQDLRTLPRSMIYQPQQLEDKIRSALAV